MHGESPKYTYTNASVQNRNRPSAQQSIVLWRFSMDVKQSTHSWEMLVQTFDLDNLGQGQSFLLWKAVDKFPRYILSVNKEIQAPTRDQLLHVKVDEINILVVPKWLTNRLNLHKHQERPKDSWVKKNGDSSSNLGQVIVRTSNMAYGQTNRRTDARIRTVLLGQIARELTAERENWPHPMLHNNLYGVTKKVFIESTTDKMAS